LSFADEYDINGEVTGHFVLHACVLYQFSD